MKRKHEAMFCDQTGHDNADSQHSFAHSKIGQYLRGQDLLTEVKHVGPQGWGLVAKQQVRQGSLVLEFKGDLISKAEALQRVEEYEKEYENDRLHLLHLSPSYVIDATHKGNKARYMRHAANANCQSQKWVVADNQPRAFMVALRDIAAGEELTFDSYRQCSLGAHVRCMCGPVMCHSNQGTPVLQSQSDTELMADAVLKCIQANQQTTSRPRTSTPPHLKQRPPCTVSPPAFASPPQAIREDINALGLDSPDSFLDDLHRSAAQPPSSLQAISSRCRSIIGQLADPTACPAQQEAGATPCEPPSSRAGDDNSGAMLASSGDGPRFASLQPGAAQQLAAPGRLSRFAGASPAQAEAGPASPARQVVQQLQSFLAPCKHVLVGGYDWALQPGQIQQPAPPYKPMKALKSVLGPKLQAGNVTSLDIGWLLQEAGWPPQLHPVPSHKSSPFLTSLPASSPGTGTGFPLQPIAAPATCIPPPNSAASPRGPSLLSAQQLGSMQPASAAQVACALTGYPLPLDCTSVAEQQPAGEDHALPVMIGTQTPANTPEQMQSCLVSLGLTSEQIQACLENAQRIEGCL